MYERYLARIVYGNRQVTLAKITSTFGKNEQNTVLKGCFSLDTELPYIPLVIVIFF